MKAIILTQSPVNESERELLKKAKIFKLALNRHAEDLQPDARIISDYCLGDICKKFSQKIISVRDRFGYETNRVEYFNGEFKGATIVSAIDYLISKNYDEILIVGDNTVHGEEFQSLIKREIDNLKDRPKIYQYTNGNFNLPTLSITEFCV